MRTNPPVRYIKIQGNILKETEKAMLFQARNASGILTSEWIPISQCSEIHRNENEDSTELHLAEWIAEKKGFISYEDEEEIDSDEEKENEFFKALDGKLKF